MHVFNSKIAIKFSILFISFALVSVCIYRATKLSFTHDESYTYMHSVKRSFAEIFTNNDQHIPNNHILNSVMIKLSEFVFSKSELALRLPNIIAFIFYLFFSYLILEMFIKNWWLLIAFIIFQSPFIILEYFGLARGYGLSMAFMLISIYYHFKFTSNWKLPELIKSLLFASLAVLSNFTLLNFYFALVFCQSLLIADALFRSENKISSKDAWSFLILLFSFTTILILAIMIPLKAISNDFFGVQTGFWEGTVKSVTNYMFYQSHPFLAECFTYIIILILIIVSLRLNIQLFGKKIFSNQLPALSMLIIVCVTGFVTVIENRFFNVPFLENRTGMFFIPLFLLLILLVLFDEYNSIKKNIFAKSSAIIICAGLLFVNLNAFNLRYTLEWKYDADTKTIMGLIRDDIHKQQTKTEYKAGIDWMFEPTMNFYRLTMPLPELKELNRDGFSGDFDYYVLQPWDTMPSVHYIELMKSDLNGVKLLKTIH